MWFGLVLVEFTVICRIWDDFEMCCLLFELKIEDVLVVLVDYRDMPVSLAFRICFYGDLLIFKFGAGCVIYGFFFFGLRSEVFLLDFSKI